MPGQIMKRNETGLPAPLRHQRIEHWQIHHTEEKNPMNTIADLISWKDIILDLEVADKDQLFDQIGRHMEISANSR